MDTYGWLSILPPVIAIILAIRTKQVYISLASGIFLGYLVIAGWNPFLAIHISFEALVDVFKNPGSTQTIIFCILMGALIEFSKKSGGIAGFVSYIEKIIHKKHQSGTSPTKMVQLLAATSGVVIFIETSISSLTVGTLFKPLFEKFGISKEKLAYIVDSSSAPASALIPFNAWGAFIMGLLVSQGIDAPFKTMMGVLSLNLYSIISILLLFIVIVFSISIGPMRKYERIAVQQKSQKVTNEISTGKQTSNRSINFILPLSIMVLSMPVYLAITGFINTNGSDDSLSFWELIGNGNGALAVLYAVTTALFIGSILYKTQKIIGFKDQVDIAFKGMGDLFPLGVLMIFAFMISGLCKELGTGMYVAQLAKSSVPAFIIPGLIFLLSSFIAFSTGTSWGTFAIMISIAIPLSVSFEMNPSLLTAAVIGGGVFGDHCSPISDTTIISSMASGCDHINHVKTQMPYALLAGLLSFIGFVILGLLSVVF